MTFEHRWGTWASIATVSTMERRVVIPEHNRLTSDVNGIKLVLIAVPAAL